MENTISKEVINEALKLGHEELRKVTKDSHDLNDHIREMAWKYFKPSQTDLVPVGVIIMHSLYTEDFRKALSSDIPQGMHVIFSGIFLRKLLKLKGVQEEYYSIVSK